jgi:O-antigen/teichoic acid export membrane protein
MNPAPSFLRDVRHYLSGRAVLIALGFVTFPLLTRMLSVGDYGQLSLVLRIILLLTVLSKCGLQYSSARFHQTTTNAPFEQKRQFYSTLVLGPVLSAAVTTAIYLPILILSRNRIADVLLYRCLLLAPILVFTRALQSLLLSFLRSEGRSSFHAVLEVASRVLTLIALVLLFFSGLKTSFAVLVATTGCEGLIVLLQMGELLKCRLVHYSAVNWPLIRTSFLFGAPLIGYELASILLDSGDRVLVRHFLGDISLGYYSAAYNVSAYLQDTVMTPLNLAIFPVFMRLWEHEGRKATQRFLSDGLTWFIVGSFALTALSLLCSRDAVLLLASKRFLDASRLLPILVPGLLIYASHIFLNVGLILEKRTVLLAVLVSGAAIFNLGINVYLIPRMGISGAAWATLVSYAALIALLARINQAILPLHPDFRLILQSGAAACLAFLPCAFLHDRLPILTLALRSSVFIILFATFLVLCSSTVRTLVAAFARGDQMVFAPSRSDNDGPRDQQSLEEAEIERPVEIGGRP